LEAITTSTDPIPALVDRKRLDLVGQLKRVQAGSQRPAWREIEASVRRQLADWRSLLTSDVSKSRQAFRQLLTMPIKFTPFVERGYRGVRFEGRCDLDAVFGGVVTKGSSPTGGLPEWTREIPGEVPAVGAGKAA
jgi:hypothetical protein